MTASVLGAVHFHRAVLLADRFGNQKPWRELAARTYTIADAGNALDTVARRAATKA